MSDEESNDLNFEEEKLPSSANQAAAQEEIEFYRRSAMEGEPGIVIPIFRRGYVKIHDPSGATTMAFVVFVCLCILIGIAVLAAFIFPERSWFGDFIKILGQALLAVVGFLVGASTGSKPTRKKR